VEAGTLEGGRRGRSWVVGRRCYELVNSCFLHNKLAMSLLESLSMFVFVDREGCVVNLSVKAGNHDFMVCA
jgi:hypothetical protein